MDSFFTADKLVDAISQGAMYALIAVGYTMVYGIIKLINFAHGEIYMLGAFWALLVVGLEQATGANLFVAIVPAILLCAGVGVTVDWSAYLSLRRRLPFADLASVVLLGVLSVLVILYKLAGDSTHPWYSPELRSVWGWGLIVVFAGLFLMSSLEKFGSFGPPHGSVKSDRLSALITAIGMSLMLQTIVQLIWGADSRVFPEASIPDFMNANAIDVAGVLVKGKELLIWVVALFMMIGLHLLVTKTKIGTAMRACSMDQQTAALMGISVDKVIAFTFLVGSGMAAVAGVLYAAKVGGNISFRMGYYPGLLAFAAAVLGGIGNIKGAMLGGVLIGFVQAFSGGTFAVPFAVMILVLLVLPRGILGEPDAGRA